VREKREALGEINTRVQGIKKEIKEVEESFRIEGTKLQERKDKVVNL
jgi:hypothetical protein